MKIPRSFCYNITKKKTAPADSSTARSLSFYSFYMASQQHHHNNITIAHSKKKKAGKSSFEPSIAEKSLHARRTLGRSRIKSLDIESSIAAGRAGGSCRLLRRQFSLDRADEPTGGSSSTSGTSSSEQQQQQQVPLQHRPPPRLFKQNSAGAANDLERIEEVPSTPQAGGSAGQAYRHSASVSLSVESLTLR